jgi:hypothetical protein
MIITPYHYSTAFASAVATTQLPSTPYYLVTVARNKIDKERRDWALRDLTDFKLRMCSAGAVAGGLQRTHNVCALFRHLLELSVPSPCTNLHVIDSRVRSKQGALEIVAKRANASSEAPSPLVDPTCETMDLRGMLSRDLRWDGDVGDRFARGSRVGVVEDEGRGQVIRACDR